MSSLPWAFLASAFVVLLLGSSFSDARTCIVSDYVQQFGPCLAGPQRWMYFAKNPKADCDGPATLDGLNSTVSCMCTASEITPILNETCAANGTQGFLRYEVSSSCTLDSGAMNSWPSGPQPCSCSAADLGATYSACDANGIRRTASFWRRNCTPSGSVSLLPSVDSPCDLTCPDGQYLAAPNALCANCPAGTTSSTAKVLGAPYTSVPKELISLCYFQDSDQETLCDSWAPCDDGQCLTSGTSLKGMTSVVTYLSLSFEVLDDPASLSFEYKVSTEKNGDYFVFEAQGKTVYWDSGVSDWKKFSYPIAVDSRHCRYTVNGMCLHHNQLAPYRVTSFFSPSKLATPQSYTALNVQTSDCTIPSSYGGRMVLVAVTAKCSVQSYLTAAASLAPPPSVLLFWNTSTVTGNSALIPDGVLVGHVDPDAAAQIITSIQQNKPVTVAYNPNPGHRMEFQFIYMKDVGTDANQDQVYLRNIEIKGLQRAADSCTPCPPGTGSVSGASSCSACPPNTYADVPGVPYPCIPCPLHSVSAAGSTGCIASSGCTIDDYLPVYGLCTKQADGSLKRSLSFVPSATPMCDLSTSTFRPPDAQLVACADCDIGSYRSDNGPCVYCPEGTFAAVVNGTSGCQQCPAGQVAKPTLDYTDFDRFNNTFPANWVPTCTSCVGPGWDFSTTMSYRPGVGVGGTCITVGRSVMVGAKATLTLNIETVLPGTIRMSYYSTYAAPQDLNNVQVTLTVVDAITNRTLLSNALYLYSDSGTSSNVGSLETVSLPAGQKRVTFTYQRIKQGPEVIFNIKSLRIAGAKGGGADSCRVCPAGFACSPSTQPVECTPGQFAPEGSSSCKDCGSTWPIPTFSGLYAQGQCANCPLGTITAADRKSCVLPNCIFLSTFLTHLANHSLDKLDGLDSLHGTRAANTKLELRDISFDLSPFAGKTNVVLNDGSPLAQPVFFQLCEPLSPEDAAGCTTRPGLPSFGCVQAPDLRTQNQNLGNKVSFQELDDAQGEPYGLVATMSGGTCRDGSGNTTLATFTLLCDSVNTKLIQSANFLGSCTYNFTILSRYACPMCNNQSFVHIDGDCDANNFRTRTYHYALTDGTVVSTPTCFGGIPLPKPRTIKCPYQITLDQGFNAAWGFMLGVLMLIIILACCATYQWVAHRRLYAKYGKLQQQQPTSDATEFHDISPAGRESPGVQSSHPPGVAVEAEDERANNVHESVADVAY